ncbi:MAG TPA: hypothetical protein VFT87_02090 [Candidatus Saccharimonadales bacterium]|nr:hypothetical protein [Candidatus Saccharimonadales bacterium]
MTKTFETKVLEALGGLQQDVGTLKQDVSILKQDIGVLKKDVRRLEVLQEETSDKIDLIIEGFAPTVEKVADHDVRLNKLEAMA